MASVRKNQARLTAGEWQQLIDAINRLHGVGARSPAYRDFVAVHVDAMTTAEGMSWGVHTMSGMMIGRNFLAWHRRYLLDLEQRLQQVHPGVTIPYWDWVANPEIPAPLTDRALLRSWSVRRGTFDPSHLPTAPQVNAVLRQSGYPAFQSKLEAIHGWVHNAIGGDMAKARSPQDPLFFLHHANVDRLWSRWQKSPQGSKPPNTSETLQPAPLFGVRVSTVLDIKRLGYRYS